MTRSSNDSMRQIQDFHEKHMTDGQAHYFTHEDGQLDAVPLQKAWLDIHLGKALCLLAPQSTERLLDLGCGEGYFTLPLASAAKESIGLDFTGAALRVFRSQTSLQSQSIYLGIADGEQIPISSESFDKAFCNHMLEHVLDDDAVVAELHRVMRPNGQLLIGVPLALAPQINLLLRLRRLLFPTSRRLQLEQVKPGQLVPELIGIQSHIRFYSLSAVRDLLERNGFRVVRAEGVGFAMRGPLSSLFRHSSLLLYLGTALGRMFPSLGDGVLVLAERM